jgi:predicted outer membrane repeat protein
MIIRYTIFFLVIVSLPAMATIINIPDDYPTIQEGIDASTDGDTVMVQPGTYVENINFNGHNTVLGSLFLITGDTAYISETVIDGNYEGSVVVFSSGETNGTLLSGFTIQNGYAYYSDGGGILCLGSSPVITHNKIKDNDAAGLSVGGGGIYCGGSSATILNNLFQDNSVSAMFSSGGAICCIHSSSLIKGNMIISNSAKEGGGIYCRDNVIIANNRIIGNYADVGAGINCVDDNLISNNTISGNYSYGQGGGVSCLSSTSMILNSIIYENEPDQIFANVEDSLEIYYSNIQGGWEGEGNIDVHPLFRDPENGDFHLMSTVCGDPYDSPCIDAGHPDILDSLLDCSWGLGGLRSDMGAYGGGDSVTVGIDDYDIPMPQEFSLSQNYPNPFNATTLITYALSEAADVKIEIFDIVGRLVETIKDEKQEAGYHQIIWNAADRSTGIYLYRIEAGNNAETKKMLLLR